MCVLPEVATPDRKALFREKALWTIMVGCSSSWCAAGFEACSSYV
jgi:hypothetical protein